MLFGVERLGRFHRHLRFSGAAGHILVHWIHGEQINANKRSERRISMVPTQLGEGIRLQTTLQRGICVSDKKAAYSEQSAGKNPNSAYVISSLLCIPMKIGEGTNNNS